MSALNDKQLAKLTEIVTATQQPGGQGYVMAKPGDVKAMLDLGLVEGNAEIKGAFGAIAWRATDYGVNHVEAAARPTAAVAPVFGNPALDTARAADVTIASADHGDGVAHMTTLTPAALVSAIAAAPAVLVVKVSRSIADFEIEDGIAPPADALNRKRGGARPDLYPFAKLEVGQSFFVPSNGDRPEPWKSLASTVNTAMTRFAVPHADGGTRTNRNNEVVPVLTRTRLFTLAKGNKGEAIGARIFRTA